MKFTFLLFALFWLSPVSTHAQTQSEDQINQFLKSYCQAQAESSIAQVAQQYWILDAQTVLWHSLDDGITLVYDAASMPLRQEAPAKKGNSAPSNIKLVVQGAIASVSYNEKTTFSDGAFVERLALGCVEQVAGIWKWHMLTYHTIDQHK